MEEQTTLDILKEIHHLSLDLLSLSEEEKWDSLAPIVEKREARFHLVNQEQHLAVISQATEESEVAHYLFEIKRINLVLSESAFAQRDNLMSELRQQSQATKAIDAYRQ